MLLINWEINLILNSAENCVISSASGAATFLIKDTKRYVPVITLSIQGNIKLLKQLEWGFKSRINWNKYEYKLTEPEPNRYLDYLIDLNFQEVTDFLFIVWK